MYEFEVPGKITGKARPRVNTLTGRAYTPGNTKDYEMLIKQYFKVKYPRYIYSSFFKILITCSNNIN